MSADSRHSVALVLLVTLMIVATSHWMISNKSSTTGTNAGGNDVASAAGWCNGSTVNGQCQPTYGGDLVDLNMQDLSDTVVEFDSDGHYNRRVLADGDVPPLDIRRSLNERQAVCFNQNGQRYTCHVPNNGHFIPPCPPKATYNRNCFKVK